MVWTEKIWIEYVSDEKVQTYVLKVNEDLAGYFELILHSKFNEVEIAYLGLLSEYQQIFFKDVSYGSIAPIFAVGP